ncbi:unnamed protein product, partial [Ascophyllum nodosum]
MARCQGNRLGAQDRSSLFLVIPFGRTVMTTFHTHPMPQARALEPARCRYRQWEARVHVHSPGPRARPPRHLHVSFMGQFAANAR